VPPLEAWQKVNVKDSFTRSTHGQMGCTACHLGNSGASGKGEAHVNLVARPSAMHQTYCGGCHGTVSADHSTSLHADLKGYYRRIELRLGYSIAGDQDLVEKFDEECGKCHASCGQCHVSRPVSVDGGFINGHNFLGEPSMKENCTACHGSRVGAEYFGENAGIKADVHWIPNVKRCSFCHDAAAMHGSSPGADYRYNDLDMVRCEDCHATVSDANSYHQVHWGDLSCQVCHSQPYKNCNSCHTGGEGITGSSYITFKIGKNPLDVPHRTYKYVTVRHIPIAPDTYASWGISDLPNYNAEPTWKYATPHNIQRWTDQTDNSGGGACFEKCHDSDYYLTLDDLQPYETEANRDIVMGN